MLYQLFKESLRSTETIAFLNLKLYVFVANEWNERANEWNVSEEEWNVSAEEWNKHAEEWNEYAEEWNERAEEWNECVEEWNEFGNVQNERAEEWNAFLRIIFIFERIIQLVKKSNITTRRDLCASWDYIQDLLGHSSPKTTMTIPRKQYFIKKYNKSF